MYYDLWIYLDPVYKQGIITDPLNPDLYRQRCRGTKTNQYQATLQATYLGVHAQPHRPDTRHAVTLLIKLQISSSTEPPVRHARIGLRGPVSRYQASLITNICIYMITTSGFKTRHLYTWHTLPVTHNTHGAHTTLTLRLPGCTLQ